MNALLNAFESIITSLHVSADVTRYINLLTFYDKMDTRWIANTRLTFAYLLSPVSVQHSNVSPFIRLSAGRHHHMRGA